MTLELTEQMKNNLIFLVNDFIDDLDVHINEGEYQKVMFRIYDASVIKYIIKLFKFKDLGSVYDYPNIFEPPEVLDGNQIINNFDMLQRIAASEKINSVLFYTSEVYGFTCNFIIDKKYLKKFSKKTKNIISQDKKINRFKNIDFNMKKNEYFEINDGDNIDDTNRTVVYGVYKKKIKKELLVFDKDSEIFQVMNDIKIFFTDETKKLYKDMNIVYKRGIILYGDPGNGKSAMIRELIRQTSTKIIKIIINPDIHDITNTLTLLLEALEGRQAIIIIEDIDSLINSTNRSAFLNILDGIDVKSGIYFIGTTNYPERIDPAFMNRSGRFDRTYKIDNPSEVMRREYFKSRKIDHILSTFKVFEDGSVSTSTSDIIDLFVKYSEGFSVANLKELLISTQYALAINKNLSIEEVLKNNSEALTKIKEEHKQSYTMNSRNRYSEFKSYD